MIDNVMGCQNLKMRLASVRKRYVILALGIITITIWLSRCHIDSKLDGDQRLYLMNGFKPALTDDENIYIEHFQTVYDYYQQRKGWNLSRLGSFLYQNIPAYGKEKKFKILIHRDGDFLERRHLRYFANETHGPFDRCSVNNCELTYNTTSDFDSSDAVMILLHRLPSLSHLPKGDRPKNQRWIFLTDEAPYATSMHGLKWENFSGVFNWSMSYRSISDIPVPYGRTVALEPYKVSQYKDLPITNLIPNYDIKKEDVLLAIAMSNCGGRSKRFDYLRELMKHIDVDMYGKCSSNPELKNGCPTSYTDCFNLNKYKFYLAFENTNCDEYITEKVFHNAYFKGNIPIVLGTTKSIYKSLLPPNSFIHVDDFASPKDLAQYIMELNSNKTKYEELHAWRKHFSVENEHGYMGSPSFHYCRICEALNYNDPAPKVYYKEDLARILSKDNCQEVGKPQWTN